MFDIERVSEKETNLDESENSKVRFENVIKLGVVGYGFIAHRHIKAYQHVSSPRVVLSAICDRNPAVKNIVSGKFSGARFYTDLDLMLDNEKLDLVHISTPPLTHAPLSIQCMEQGCNVVVEKPMATNLADADRMINIMNKNNVQLHVLHTSLFNPAFLRLLKMIRQGEVGEVFGVDINYFGSSEEPFIVNPNHWSHRLPGGAFCESLPHPLYLLHSILPKLEVQSVFAQKIGPLAHVKIDDLCALLVGESSGATLRMGWVSPRNMGVVRVYGTEAIVDCDIHGLSVVKHKRGLASPLAVGFDNLRTILSLLKDTITGSYMWAIKGWRGGYQEFIPRIVRNMVGEAPPPTNIEDAREVVRLMEQICKQVSAIAE